MNTEILNKLWEHNFTTTERGIVNRRSERTGRTKKVGQFNDSGIFFFAQNIFPFKQGQNSYKDILGKEQNYVPYIPPIKQKKSEYNFTFEQYLKTTKKKNHLSTYLSPYVKNLGSDIKSNPYDLRGVKSGYLEGATLFPYINYDNDFITAKIVRYSTVTGKRSKEEFSNNWFHAYKQIKEELGIKSQITKKVDCFFGEHLLRYNNKPVVIVEAEKTALFLSLLFEEIIFIATGGLGKLGSLEHDFLINREVFLFPDNGAKEWFKIAEERNWWCSTILENEGTKGSDIVDYFDTEIGEKLNIELTRISKEELHFSSANLNFRLKKKQSKRYCLPTFSELKLTRYCDNAEGPPFRGSSFNIYNKKFEVLSANIDFNKWQEMPSEFTNSEGNKIRFLKKVAPDASEFLNRLEKCFRIVKFLNPEQNHQELFSEMIKSLAENSNYIFNERHIIEELLPVWDNGKNDVSEYYKSRNWRFVSKHDVGDTEFLKMLSNDRKAEQTNKLLKQLYPLLNGFQYINTKDIGLKNKEQNTYVWGLVKDYNQKVLGCKTINQFHKMVVLQEYFSFIEEKSSLLELNERGFQKFRTPYKEPYIVCEKSGTPSINVINENTLIDKKTIREFLNFNIDEEFLLNLKVTVKFLLDNPNDLEFKRLNRRIEVLPSKSFEYMKKEVLRVIEGKPEELIKATANEAFSGDLDFTNSILNCDDEEAQNRGGKFLYSWTVFNNPEMTDIDKLYLKADLNYSGSMAQ